MRIQRIKLEENKYRYLVINKNEDVVVPIKDYIKFLDNTGKSENTLKNYAFHLKLYFEFLEEKNLKYNELKSNKTLIDTLSDFLSWLKNPNKKGKAINMDGTIEQKRSNKTINIIMNTVISFYEYIAKIEESDVSFLRKEIDDSKGFKGFLYEMVKNKEKVQSNIFRLKEKKKKIKVINREKYEEMLNYVSTCRDKFLIALLFESGLRIGEALGLYLEDIMVWDNKVILTERENLENGTRIKNGSTGEILVPEYVMKLFTDYITNEYKDIDSNFIFVNLKGKNKGKAMKPITIEKLFERISKEMGIKITPHMLRHSHATELIEIGGWDPIDVKERLRHKQVQTTINTYVHISDAYKKEKFNEFLKTIGKGEES